MSILTTCLPARQAQQKDEQTPFVNRKADGMHKVVEWVGYIFPVPLSVAVILSVYLFITMEK